MGTTKSYGLSESKKKQILEMSKYHSFPYIVKYICGDLFTLEQTMSIYGYMNRNKCFDFIDDVSFHNDVLRLVKEGLEDDEIYFGLSDKYPNIGPYQISSVITANSKCRRVGKWKEEDQRVLRFLYGEGSRKAFCQVLYPRLLANIQKQASRLQLNYEEPAAHIGVPTMESISVGELRKLLSEYNDDDKLMIKKIGSPDVVRIAKIGHKSGNRREHQNPLITIWDV